MIDFNGFSHKHICKRHIQLGCAWFGAHNPERLGAMVLVNPPMIFMALWSFIHMFLDPESAQRLLVFRSSAEAQVIVGVTSVGVCMSGGVLHVHVHS